MARSSIQWTNDTWNPVAGCTRVSPGCDNCYAAWLAATKLKNTRQHQGLAVVLPSGRAAFNGIIRLLPERLEEPLRWRRPRRVFVNSMSDLFHEGVPDDYIDEVFAVMAAARQHVFQVLTKRPQRMLAYMTSTANGARRQMHVQSSLDRLRRDYTQVKPHVPGWPLPNVHSAISCEDQATADERIPLLLRTPAAVRFISAEPLLGPIDLTTMRTAGTTWRDALKGREHIGLGVFAGLTKLDWVITGGESGPRARRCDLAWIRGIVQQCQVAGVPVFVKQLGALPVMREADWRAGPTRLLSARKSRRVEGDGLVALSLKDRKGGDWDEWPAELRVREFPHPPIYESPPCEMHATSRNARG